MILLGPMNGYHFEHLVLPLGALAVSCHPAISQILQPGKSILREALQGPGSIFEEDCTINHEVKTWIYSDNPGVTSIMLYTCPVRFRIKG